MPSPGSNEFGTDETLAGAESPGESRRDGVPLVRGHSVGRYVVIDRVGRGGMGVVYAAYDPELDRRVALKLLAPGQWGEAAGAEDRQRLLREAQAMAKLTHPHVVTVHDAGTFEGSVFIAMEFVDGGTLGGRIARRPPWRELLPLFVQAGTGLAAAHDAGLVHRDFKPDNVLITAAGIAKVSDFGLARASSAKDVETAPELRPGQDLLSQEITRPGALVGTPAYMAPEQHLHEPADAKSDQFSFCVALYEALWGERPFRGRSIADLVLSVTAGTIAEPASWGDVPPWLRRVVLRGLAVEPGQRWPSMAALLDALQADPSRRRARRLALGAGVLVVATGLGVMAMRDHQRRAGCAREADATSTSWNDARRESVAAAIRATDVSYAEPTIERVEALLEPWVARWTASREAACLVAADDPVAELKRSCLDERRVHLEVVLDLLEHADAALVPVAVQTVAGLPRIEPCEDATWLARTADHDGDVQAAARLALDIARLSALARARRLDDAFTLAQALLPTTEEYPARRAEVLHLLGMVEEARGDVDAGLEHLRGAYLLAGRHHADRTAALAAILLTTITGVRMGDYETGRSWADHATMMVEREPDPELRIELLYAIGALATTHDHSEEGIASFLEQVEIATSLYGADHPETAQAQVALGNAYSSGGRPQEAQAQFELARTTWERAVGPDHPTVASVVFNLGLLAYRAGRFDDALALHRDALARRQAALPAGHPDIGASFSALGALLAQSDDDLGALEHHRRAHAIVVARYGEDSARALNELYNVITDLIALERIDEAAPLLARRCAEAERVRELTPEAWLQCLDQRAQLHAHGDRHAEALVDREAAAVVAASLYGASHPETAGYQHELAQASMAVGDPVRARAELERALATYREHLDPGHPDVRAALELLGDACRDSGDTHSALAAYEAALALDVGADPGE